MTTLLKAGAAAVDISPTDSQFLFGYPFVERYSTGVHDPLLSSALYLSDGRTEVILIANDIVSFTKAAVQRIRNTVSHVTSVPSRRFWIYRERRFLPVNPPRWLSANRGHDYGHSASA